MYYATLSTWLISKIAMEYLIARLIVSRNLVLNKGIPILTLR